MELETIYSLVIFLLVVIGFVTRKIPMGVVSMGGFILMVIFGILDSDAAIGVFAKDTWIIIASLYIISASFTRTTYVNKMALWLARKCNGSTTKILLCYVLIELVLGQFISSTIARFSIEYPLLIASCREMKINRSHVILPLALVTMCNSGIVPTTAAVSMSIRIAPLIAEYGLPQYADYPVMDYCISRIIICVIVVPIAVFLLPRLLPDRYPENYEESSSADANKLLGKEQELAPWQEKLVLAIFLIVCLGFLFNEQINRLITLPLWVIAITGALLIAGFGILRGKQLYSNMGLNVIFLALGATGIGSGLAASGASDIIGNLLITMFGEHPNGYVVCWVVFMIGALLSNFITHPPVTWTFIPIVVIACKAFGANPCGLCFMLLSANQLGVLFPTASTASSVMFTVGGYEIRDTIKIGIPLILFCSVVYTAVIMTIFPFYS